MLGLISPPDDTAREGRPPPSGSIHPAARRNRLILGLLLSRTLLNVGDHRVRTAASLASVKNVSARFVVWLSDASAKHIAKPFTSARYFLPRAERTRVARRDWCAKLRSFVDRLRKARYLACQLSHRRPIAAPVVYYDAEQVSPYTQAPSRGALRTLSPRGWASRRRSNRGHIRCNSRTKRKQ